MTKNDAVFFLTGVMYAVALTIFSRAPKYLDGYALASFCVGSTILITAIRWLYRKKSLQEKVTVK